MLRIRQLKRDLDTGLYQCNATNAQGTLSGATFLNVQGKSPPPLHHSDRSIRPFSPSLSLQFSAFAPRFGHSDHRVWKVLRGSVVDLNCEVQAAPKARVRWVDANDTGIVAVPGKLEVGGTLRHSAHLTLLSPGFLCFPCLLWHFLGGFALCWPSSPTLPPSLSCFGSPIPKVLGQPHSSPHRRVQCRRRLLLLQCQQSLRAQPGHESTRSVQWVGFPHCHSVRSPSTDPTYFVEVPHPPSLAVEAFESLELRCRAVADPRLAVEYVWTRNGEPMEENARVDE